MGAVGRTPRYKNGKQESALPSMVCESGYHLPFGSAFQLSVCVWGGVCVNDRRGNGVLFLCSLWMSPAERLAVPSCVSLAVCLSHEPFGHARWGRGCTWADWQQVSQQVPRRSCPAPAPFPTGRGPIHRLLRSQPARRLNQNQLFSSLSYCLLSPAAIVEGCLFFGHLLLDLSLEMGFPRAAGTAPVTVLLPQYLLRPFHRSQPWFFHQVSPRCGKSAQHPTPQPVC